LLLVSCLVFCSTLKMEAIRSSDKSVDLHRTTRHYNLEDIPRSALPSRHCENLKSSKVIVQVTWYEQLSSPKYGISKWIQDTPIGFNHFSYTIYIFMYSHTLLQIVRVGILLHAWVPCVLFAPYLIALLTPLRLWPFCVTCHSKLS
jgi:hypothetical protein